MSGTPRILDQKLFETGARMLSLGESLKIFGFSLINLLLFGDHGVVVVVVGGDPTPATGVRGGGSHDFTQDLLNLLGQCERSERVTADTQFGALIAEFLIKENVRYFEPTRYEEQLYADLLQRLSAVIARARRDPDLGRNLTAEQRTILANVFQKNVQLHEPRMRSNHIDTHFEFESLVGEYGELVNTGFPDAKLSDSCLATLVSSRTCDISDECMDIITSDLPTFGYQRTHQILLLYVFMHHKCAHRFGSQMAYEILGSQRCTQVYREQNVIRSLGIPDVYRDLYLEQSVVCGLLGYPEFLNWRHVDEISSWPHAGDCLCQTIDNDIDNADLNNCECFNHINSLAIVYLTNALLRLD